MLHQQVFTQQMNPTLLLQLQFTLTDAGRMCRQEILYVLMRCVHDSQAHFERILKLDCASHCTATVHGGVQRDVIKHACICTKQTARS